LLLTNTARRAFVALFLVVFALGLTACGGEDPNQLIDETFKGGDEKVDSGKLSVGITVRTQGSPQLSQPVDLKLNGPFQRQGKNQLPKFDFGLAANVAGRSLGAGAVSTGDGGFLKIQGQAYKLDDSQFNKIKQSYQQAQVRSEQEKKKGDTSPAALGIDPGTWLREAKVVGDEDVAGTETTHVSAKVDVPKLLDDVSQALSKARSQGLPQAGQLPSALTPEQRQRVQEAIRGATFDFWTGKEDKVLRKLQINLDFQVPPAERARTSGVTGGRVGFTLQMADLNESQTIAAPANARPISELGGALGALGGAGGGTSGAPSGAPGAPSGAPGAPSGAPGANPAYLQCVQAAAGDPAKLQQCAALR
jgi:hypothetical protein